MKRCVIICASPYYQADFIKSELTAEDYIICADGGCEIAAEINIKPSLIIGDLDSSRLANAMPENRIELPTEKDDTDSIYCAKHAIAGGFKEFLILGATGGRIDHMYANLALLKFLYESGCTAVIKDEQASIYYTESTLVLSCKGKTVSILPYGCESAEVSLTGFKYGAQHLIMTSDFPIGISNIAEKENSAVTLHSGGIIAVVNNYI